MTKLCDYGCGREAKHPLKNGKWCCSKNHQGCYEVKRKNRESNIGQKKKPHTKDTKKKISISSKITIEQIQERYPFFSQIEDMRYNPYKLKENEIQVRCMKCKKWFSFTYEQFRARRDALDHADGNDGCYFYCSEGCKYNCPCHNLYVDPHTLTKYKLYLKNVYKETYKTIKNYGKYVTKLELRGYEHGYALDHRYSIYDGFINNVNPKIIGHWKNLQMITEKENVKKGKKSSITLEELLNNIGDDI